jgi:glutamate racemase
MIDAPIGIFDSGLGGLTVVKQVIEKMPNEGIIYVGDEAHVPYGEKTSDEIKDYALGITEYLISRGSKLVIMACNMSSANALIAARKAFPETPIIGTIDAGSRTAANVAVKRIGVLATKGTVASGAYTETIRTIDDSIDVYEQGCPKFVPIVESDMCGSSDADDAAHEYVAPLKKAGCDTLILGCTHYPFLMDAICGAAGCDIKIIDPAEETTVQAYEILKNAGLLNSSKTEPARAYITTAFPERFESIGGRFLGMKVDVRELKWGIDLREHIWSEMMAEQTTSSAR